MFDEKEEDKRVADYGQCPHNHQENETGKKNLKIQILSSMLKVFIFYSRYIPIGECRATLGRNPQKKSFCQSTMFHCLRMRGTGAGQHFSFKFSLYCLSLKEFLSFSPFLNT